MGVAETIKGNGRMKREKRSKRKGGGGAVNKEQGILNYLKLLSGFRKHPLTLPVLLEVFFPSRQSGTTCLMFVRTFCSSIFHQFHLTP